MNIVEKEIINIDYLIEQFSSLYDSVTPITFRHKNYLEFKNNLTKFIYENHLNQTTEWELISKNLVIKSSQYMVVEEADIILEQLEKIKLILLEKKNEYFGQYIHPIIKELVFVKYNSKQYADAVESAFKEINSRLKKIYRKHYSSPQLKEPDGKNLIEYIFALEQNRLKFENISTESGENIQKGYIQIFSGAITAIRNPKAHENLTLTKDSAIKRLILASLLMDKIDDAIAYTNIAE